MFPDHRRVSSDDLRQAVMGDTYDGERNEEIWEIYYADLTASLRAGMDVVADATNLTRKHRNRTLEAAWLARTPGEVTLHAVVFKNPVQAISRNRARSTLPGTKQGDQRVDDESMMGMIRLYEQMLSDISDEGWNTITYLEGWNR
jgi:predicted kinase